MCKTSPSSASPLSAQGHKGAEKFYTSGPLVEPNILNRRQDNKLYLFELSRERLKPDLEPLDSTGEEMRSETPALASLRSSGGTDKGDK